MNNTNKVKVISEWIPGDKRYIHYENVEKFYLETLNKLREKF